MAVNPSGPAGENGVRVDVLDEAVAVRVVGEIDPPRLTPPTGTPG